MILKRSLLKFIKTGGIPLLLTTIALRQIALVHIAGLSPWHGGGYGMFASIDRDERRVITTQLIGCEQTEEINLQKIVADTPGVLSRDTYTHVSTFPTEAQLRRMGRRLLASDSQAIRRRTNREQGCKLQLQPWRLVYDGRYIVYESLTDPVEVQP
ncbi:hypothetical protein IQ260_10460 [Leptolyngbya cf. ectocarpi LEGE 11479]|uniref:Uncharacterized protein n=1 Tax=Leptolyngbya cf. ectocarpi LEGE 11479 TaxID=1828722 RepID=A0A928ZTD1_LEPEC|nr:hypothetical protein [Leptolyngbya ectocarpi]MBE9067076.1 hypothetical protein [Leptolyngbya cf. ectocarpi LEGE 11479]